LPPEPSASAAVLSYLIPGLGQISQGRYGKGVLFMVSLLGMFSWGRPWGNGRMFICPVRKSAAATWSNSIANRWHYAGQFWIGVSAWPALWSISRCPVPAADTQPFCTTCKECPMNKN